MFGCLRKKQQREANVLSIDVGRTLLKVAIGEIGNGERGANNDGSHVARYAAAANWDPPVMWCALFYYYCYVVACDNLAVDPIVPNFKRGAIRNRNVARAKDLAWLIEHVGGEKVSFLDAAPGDLVLWHRGKANARTGHAGVLQSRNVIEQTFTTVEGNKGYFPANVRVFNHANGEANLLGFYRLPRHKVTSDE